MVPICMVSPATRTNMTMTITNTKGLSITKGMSITKGA